MVVSADGRYCQYSTKFPVKAGTEVVLETAEADRSTSRLSSAIPVTYGENRLEPGDVCTIKATFTNVPASNGYAVTIGPVAHFDSSQLSNDEISVWISLWAKDFTTSYAPDGDQRCTPLIENGASPGSSVVTSPALDLQPAKRSPELVGLVQEQACLVRVSASIPVAEEISISLGNMPLSGSVSAPDKETGAPLASLLPTANEVPIEVVAIEEGSRTAREIIETFPDPIDAAARFNEWGWEENAFHTFESADGSELIQVSLHRFEDEDGASAALSYFVDARSITSGVAQIPLRSFGDQSRAVAGWVSETYEVTVYVQNANDLVRVTVLSEDEAAVQTAEAVASAIVE